MPNSSTITIKMLSVDPWDVEIRNRQRLFPLGPFLTPDLHPLGVLAVATLDRRARLRRSRLSFPHPKQHLRLLIISTQCSILVYNHDHRLTLTTRAYHRHNHNHPYLLLLRLCKRLIPAIAKVLQNNSCTFEMQLIAHICLAQQARYRPSSQLHRMIFSKRNNAIVSVAMMGIQ